MFNKEKDSYYGVDHEHTYLPLQNGATKSQFEPVDARLEDDTILYKMVEYMYMFCKCGEGVRTKIKTQKQKEGNDDSNSN